MKRRLLGVFNSIDDAKHALGQIKKEGWNQTQFMVIVGEPDANRDNQRKTHFEIAGENFLENNHPATGSGINRVWPGLKEMELAGVGTVNVGYNIPVEESNESAMNQQLSETDIQVVEREIFANKIVALIEVEEQFIPKLRFIMDTNGAELLE